MFADARRKALLWAVLSIALPAIAPVAADAAGFGIEPGSFSTVLSGNDAGEHADLTATFTLNQEPINNPTGYLKDVGLAMPPGFVGDSTATPRCNMGEVAKETCPEQDAVGVASLTSALPPEFEGVETTTVLVYNIAPYTEEAAAFAFEANGTSIRLDTSLSVENDYGLAMSATDVSDARPVISTTITLWGIPADHNGPGPFETGECPFNETTEEETCDTYGAPGVGARLPLLSDPVSCETSVTGRLSVDSWQAPGSASQATASLGPIGECENLRFEPSISLLPEQTQAREPTGYQVAVHLPSDENPDDRAAADLKNARLDLPPGTVISPSATSGLQACSDSQFQMNNSTAASCAQASQIGAATIKTPLLAEAMQGELFLGSPECGPCSGQDAQEGKMIRVLVQASGSGVIVKLDGSISVDQATGHLTLTINEAPQLPVEELKLDLDGGPRALLANPTECSVALNGSAQLTPYSSSLATEVAGPSFQPTGCAAPQFTPSLEAGTVSNLAASPSSTIISIARSDQDQTLERFTVSLPPGLLGLLSKVPACPPTVAQAGACDIQSQLGSVTIAAGPGTEPLSLAGAVFLTGPEEGAPFGLSIAVPAQAGPIDLGNIQISAGIHVDPATAALTISSGAVPQSLAGVPLQIRSLRLDIDRAGFMVNPTNCRPQAIDASITSSQGTPAPAAEHFQAAGCAKLAFKPKLTALADAKATRLGGAYVHLKLASAPGEANISKVKLDFPKALPSRLTTLQGACREAVFKADPASCPGSSIIGTGAITTPFLRGLMRGPVYLVSHGSRAFPDLDAVMQGEGVTLILTGTASFANGISSDAFRTLPDAPISTLDLMFPQGPSSAFAANASLCNRTLKMPTELTGQNGAVVKQTTRIAVSGCSRGKAARSARHAGKGIGSKLRLRHDRQRKDARR